MMDLSSMKGLTGITSDNDIYKFTAKVNLYKQSILTDYIATPPFSHRTKPFEFDSAIEKKKIRKTLTKIQNEYISSLSEVSFALARIEVILFEPNGVRCFNKFHIRDIEELNIFNIAYTELLNSLKKTKLTRDLIECMNDALNRQVIVLNGDEMAGGLQSFREGI